MSAVIVTIMTITWRSISSANSYCDNNARSKCTANSYCDNNDNNWNGLYVVLTVIVKTFAITGRSICSANSYCDNNDNNGEACMQY